MVVQANLASVIASQLPSGAFPSTIVSANGTPRGVDANAFVTVQVVRALANLATDEWMAARDRAVAFLERCEVGAAAYGLWPRDDWPSWAPYFGPDIDDTALIADTLAALGRLRRDAILEVVATMSMARVRTPESPGAPWISPGAFGTWIDGPPIVDCAVNANVAGFLAGSGWQGRFGYDAAVATINGGVDWAGDSWSRLQSIAPFYPHPGELHRAVGAAVDRGADDLTGTFTLLSRRYGDRLAVDASTPVCGSAYGAIRWYAPVLAAARALTDPAVGPAAGGTAAT